jgi:hypothetical protein
VGDRVGVGTYVNSCRDCENCTSSMENHCPQLVYTFNMTDADGSVTKGGYSTHIVVHERYAILHVLFAWFLEKKNNSCVPWSILRPTYQYLVMFRMLHFISSNRKRKCIDKLEQYFVSCQQQKVYGRKYSTLCYRKNILVFHSGGKYYCLSTPHQLCIF